MLQPNVIFCLALMEIALRTPERPNWPFHYLPEPPRSVWQKFRNQYSQEQIEVVVNNWLAAHRTSVGLTEAEVHAMQSTYGQELSKKQFLSLFEKLLAYFKVPDGFTDEKQSPGHLFSMLSRQRTAFRSSKQAAKAL